MKLIRSMARAPRILRTAPNHTKPLFWLRANTFLLTDGVLFGASPLTHVAGFAVVIVVAVVVIFAAAAAAAFLNDAAAMRCRAESVSDHSVASDKLHAQHHRLQLAPLTPYGSSVIIIMWQNTAAVANCSRSIVTTRACVHAPHARKSRSNNTRHWMVGGSYASATTAASAAVAATLVLLMRT